MRIAHVVLRRADQECGAELAAAHFEISIQPYLRTLQSRTTCRAARRFSLRRGQQALDGNLGTGEFFVGR